MLGEANFSDHGANRLGASALMQGLADGYFILPYTIGDYFASSKAAQAVGHDHPEFKRVEEESRSAHEEVSVDQGQTDGDRVSSRAWKDDVGQVRHGAQRSGLEGGAGKDPALRGRSSGKTSTCWGTGNELNQSLEYAGRVADFLEFGELLVLDALDRDESCGGAFPRRVSDSRTAKQCATTRISPTSPRGSIRASGHAAESAQGDRWSTKKFT